MAVSNTSVAYDLSAFDNGKEKPSLHAVKSSRRMLSAAFSPKVLSSFAIVVTLLSLMVYNQVQLNEVSGEINRLNAQLAELQSQNVELTSDLETTVNLRTIGEQAKNQLGMHRLDQYQVEYILLEQEDKIELTEDSPNPSITQRIKISVSSTIDSLQEYIAGR